MSITSLWRQRGDFARPPPFRAIHHGALVRWPAPLEAARGVVSDVSPTVNR
ncbi:MAG: hypothetical protein WBV80_23420 [Mycobacterium sp.]